MPVTGIRVLEILKKLKAPATPKQIAKCYAHAVRKPYKKLIHQVNAALIGGKRFGYLEYCHGHYYSLKHTKDLYEHILEEDSTRRIDHAEQHKAAALHHKRAHKHYDSCYRRIAKKSKKIKHHRSGRHYEKKTKNMETQKSDIEQESFALENVKIECQSKSNLFANNNTTCNIPVGDQGAYIVECEIKNALQDIITNWKCSHTLLSITNKEETDAARVNSKMDLEKKSACTSQSGKMIQLTWQSKSDPKQKLITSHSISSNTNEVENKVELINNDEIQTAVDHNMDNYLELINSDEITTKMDVQDSDDN